MITIIINFHIMNDEAKRITLLSIKMIGLLYIMLMAAYAVPVLVIHHYD